MGLETFVAINSSNELCIGIIMRNRYFRKFELFTSLSGVYILHHPHCHRRKKMASVSDNWSIDFLITVFAQRNANTIVSILSSMPLCLYLIRLCWSETCSIYQSVNAWHNIDETISHPENVLKSVSTLNFDGYWLYESSVQFLTALMNISFGFYFYDIFFCFTLLVCSLFQAFLSILVVRNIPHKPLSLAHYSILSAFSRTTRFMPGA